MDDNFLAPGSRLELNAPKRGICPHCHVLAQAGQLSAPVNGRQPGSLAFLTYACTNCNGHIAVEVRIVQDNELSEVVRVFPPRKAASNLRDVPAGVQAAMDDAAACLSIGVSVAAAMMCRRAVEIVAHDRGADGRDLRAQIDNLDMPGGLKEIAHGIRLLGNEAARPSDEAWNSVTEGDAEALLQFTHDLVEQVYDVPARIAELRVRTGQAPASEG